MKSLAPLMMMIAAVGLFLVNNEVVPEPEREDVLSLVYKADRESRIKVLSEMKDMEFESDPQRLDWFAEEVEKHKSVDWLPFATALGDAITENPEGEYKSIQELIEAISDK